MSDHLKSQMSIMLDLQRGLLHDLKLQHSLTSREIDRDWNTIVSRAQTEGLGFFTKTLPRVAKSLDKALVEGAFTRMPEFSSTRANHPRFLRRLFERIFDGGGKVLESPDVSAIQSVRQLCYLFYKYQIPYQEATVAAAFTDFVDVDQSIKPLKLDASGMSVIYYAQEVLNEVFKDFHFKQDLRPKNGPGAVAGGEQTWERFAPSRFYPKLDSVYPYQELFYYNPAHLFDHWDRYFSLPFGSEGIAVCLAVPKDSRGPRLISKEPMEFMTYEQALKGPIVEYIEQNRLTSGQVNFTDQTINGKLALKSSEDQSLATLDLSAASDRLSLDLVDLLFEDLPELREYLINVRSGYSLTPNGYIALRKYAPMGSALTFPVQSICFFALLVGMMRRDGYALRHAAKSVWVYGDDIIVPTPYAAEAMKVLESMGLKVNADKSCYSGHFRESCGVDAYQGVDVTPVKIKRLWQRKPEITTIESWLAYSDGLFQKGFWQAAEVIRQLIETKWKLTFPLVSKESAILGYTNFFAEDARVANWSRYKWSLRYQCLQLAGIKSSAKVLRIHRNGWERMVNMAWYKKQDMPPSFEGEDFTTDFFAVRHAAVRKRATVVEHAA